VDGPIAGFRPPDPAQCALATDPLERRLAASQLWQYASAEARTPAIGAARSRSPLRSSPCYVEMEAAVVLRNYIYISKTKLATYWPQIIRSDLFKR
jgi:hypothetical protein